MVNANYIRLTDATITNKGYMVTNSLINKGSIFKTAATASTDLFAADIEPAIITGSTTMRIYACFTGSVTLSLIRTAPVGTVTDTTTEVLNGGVELAANSAYMLDIVVDVDETINFQVNANTTVSKFSVNEVVQYV